MGTTNQTYQIFVAHEEKSFTIQGKKQRMMALFEKVKYDYNYVALRKWSVRYNCWETIISTRK